MRKIDQNHFKITDEAKSLFIILFIISFSIYKVYSYFGIWTSFHQKIRKQTCRFMK